ncbi:MAG: Helix-turn-helix domain protein [Lentisphaerae bacterium ADurb.Bin242]|nr:MAG: Helix-turn-helix domain protein [Lentisphaerae bacterium ADurb.Bin242]
MGKKELQSCKEIGMLIRKLRKRQGITQAQLAGLAHTGIRFIGDLENGKETCHVGKMLRVLFALGVDIHIYSPYDKD